MKLNFFYEEKSPIGKSVLFLDELVGVKKVFLIKKYMRIIKEISHPQCKITVFSWNSKYLLKLERGLIEQTYKVPETEVSGDEDIDKLLSGEFLKKVLARFDEMEHDLLQALEEIYE